MSDDICSASEDVQYESHTSSVQATMYMWSTNEVDHQLLVRGRGSAQKYFQCMSESLLLLTDQIKRVRSIWQTAKIN